MPSDPRDPRLGNGATRPERGRFIVQMVSDEVQDLWREGGDEYVIEQQGKLRGSDRTVEASQTLRGGRMGVHLASIGPA